MRLLAFALLCSCLLLSGVTHAQTDLVSRQSTSGPNSPIIAGNSGPVTVTLIDGSGSSVSKQALNAFAAALGRRKDLVSQKIRGQIDRGDFAAARRSIVVALQGMVGSIADVAFLKYGQAVLAMIDRMPVEAEAAMRTASDLQPQNCRYLGYESNLLVQLDRMADAAYLIQGFHPNVTDCMENGKPYDRVVLNLTAAMVARDHRDELQTRGALEAAELAVGEMSLDGNDDEIEERASLACDFLRTAPMLLGFRRKPIDLDRATAACSSLNNRLGADAANFSKLWTLGASQSWALKSHEDAENQFRIYSDALDATDVLRPRPNLGYNEQTLRWQHASVLSDRGFLRLWELNELSGSRDDYQAAYSILMPLLVSNRPEFWQTYHDLTGRMVDANGLNFATPLKGGTPADIAQNLRLLLANRVGDDTMALCRVVYEMDGLARQVVGVDAGLVDAIDQRHDLCLTRMADTTTLRYRQETYHSAAARADTDFADHKLEAALKSLSEAIGLGQALYGFPLDLDADTATYSELKKRAYIFLIQGNRLASEQDLQTVIDLAKHADNDAAVSQTEVELAEQIERTDKDKLLTAQTLVNDAALQQLQFAKRGIYQSCGMVVLYAHSLVLGARISSERDNYAELQTQLGKFVPAAGLVAECTSTDAGGGAIVPSKIDTRDMAALMLIDGLTVRKILLGKGYDAVRQAALNHHDEFQKWVDHAQGQELPPFYMPLMSAMSQLGVGAH